MRKRTKYGKYALNVFAGLGLVYLFAPIFFMAASASETVEFISPLAM